VGVLAGASTREVDIQAVIDFLTPLGQVAAEREPVPA
jgi:4-hydroxy-3-methylbut-2-enyl diphosphate reductase IspH